MAAQAKENRGPAAGPENRRALIAAAREVYAVSGYSTPFSAVAKKAGVGQGSLYRHFPDRTALAVAVFDENIRVIEAHAESPDGTLDGLFDLIIEQVLVSSAFIDMIVADRDDERVVQLAARIRGAADALVARERAAGHINTSVDADDVVIAISMLASTLTHGDAELRAGMVRRAKALLWPAFASAPIEHRAD
ncbi:TetR family transcriptional regulator [Homoserinimonas aerilata]|uniref:TetR family transcriptional regulator n=1 Tax=Homoserinimonas aerilata TaxID=1162970 RepID=A0A542YG92_9MICO|nr:TetR/AcrR family transcriptional regulator [Homoserinimonas aerilata]TQL47004.1 TetR family transcriptional regulator [Homoserinimonas aerilata]